MRPQDNCVGQGIMAAQSQSNIILVSQTYIPECDKGKSQIIKCLLVDLLLDWSFSKKPGVETHFKRKLSNLVRRSAKKKVSG